MKKWVRFLPVLLLICGIGAYMYFYRPVPIESLLLPDNAESVVAAAVRRMEENDSQTYELQDADEIYTVAEQFRNINVRYKSRTDIIPIDPVLYNVTLISSKHGACPPVGIAGNGFVYIDGNRYTISSEDESVLISFLEGLFS